MTELLDNIRSRGYWRVVIRPYSFIEKRIADRSELLHILEKTSVEYKGWGFPHIDGWRKPDNGPDWIGQEISKEPILELWRFYQSGQFIHYFGMPEDWKDLHRLQSPSLEIKDIVLRFTEIFELILQPHIHWLGASSYATELAVARTRRHRSSLEVIFLVPRLPVGCDVPL